MTVPSLRGKADESRYYRNSSWICGNIGCMSGAVNETDEFETEKDSSMLTAIALRKGDNVICDALSLAHVTTRRECNAE